MKNKLLDFIKYRGNVWKAPLASALSWELAKLAGSKHPFLAPLTVILSIQLEVDKSIKFAWQRVLGTIAGVLFTVWIAPIIGVNGWSIGLLLFIGALLVTWLKFDHAIMVQVALSILLVTSLQSKMPTYPFDRIRDTIIGAVTALVIHIVILPPDSVNNARKKMGHFADHLSNHFSSTALWVNEGCPSNTSHALQSKLQSLFKELHQTTAELDKAEQSLRYNLFSTKKRTELIQLTRQMQRLRNGYGNLADMIRVLAEWSENGKFVKEHQQIWSDHLNDLAKIVEQWKNRLNESKERRLISKEYTLIAPVYMKDYQYPLALYMNAEQLAQDFQDSDHLQ